MGAPNGHSTLAPSKAHRWFACPRSVALEAEYPDNSGPDAQWGTAAHYFAAKLLEEAQQDASAKADDYIGQQHLGVECTPEMADCVQRYVDEMHRRAAGADYVVVEYEVDLSDHAGVPDQSGTLDFGFIKGSTAYVFDLKTSARNLVYASDILNLSAVAEVEELERAPNKQLGSYALGFVKGMELLVDIDKVVIGTVMPRVETCDGSVWVSTYEMSKAELIDFAKEFRDRATDCTKAIKYHAEHRDDPTDVFWYSTGAHCDWCKGRAGCPAQAEVIQGLMGFTHEHMADIDPEQKIDAHDLGGETLAIKFAALPWIEKYIKAIRAEVERRVLAGEVVDDGRGHGAKPVRGKKGNREFDNVEAVTDILRKARGVRLEDCMNSSLKSPTQLEKMLPPNQWAKLKDHVTQAPGSVIVVPLSDGRTPVSVTAPADELMSIDEDDPEALL